MARDAICYEISQINGEVNRIAPPNHLRWLAGRRERLFGEANVLLESDDRHGLIGKSLVVLIDAAHQFTVPVFETGPTAGGVNAFKPQNMARKNHDRNV